MFIQELELARGRLESGERLIDPNTAKLEATRKELEENKQRIISRDDKILVRTSEHTSICLSDDKNNLIAMLFLSLMHSRSSKQR